MVTTVNASTSTGLVSTADTSGIMCVYWLRCEDHTDMFSQGYIGITKHGRQERRLWEHKNVSQNSHLLNALDKYDVVQDILLIADEDYCKDIEQKLRPEINIGWNIVTGGGLPPSFKGKKRSAEFVEKARTRKDSDQTKLKKSIAALGNKRGKGRKLTEQQKLAVSVWMKGRKNALGKQNALVYQYIGTNINTGETITLIGGKPVKDAGFHFGHVSSCACGTEKSHKGYTWKKEAIHDNHN
jgi:hypothetical protein